MEELRNYLEFLDWKIGCSNDYLSLINDGYDKNEIKKIVIESLMEISEGIEEDEKLLYDKFIMKVYNL
jgi:hypothetical protein